MPQEKWTAFYEPYFTDRAAAEAFVVACEETEGPHPAKIIMHQTQRLVTLTEDLLEIRDGQEGLRVLFLMMCVEAVSKLQGDFDGEGQSKRYARRFFEIFVDQQDQERLRNSAERTNGWEPFTLQEVVDGFYKVRCDVVHEGTYWRFAFSSDGVSTISPGVPFSTDLAATEFTAIVVRGCIAAAMSRL